MFTCIECTLEKESSCFRLRGHSKNFTICETCYHEKQKWAQTKSKFKITKQDYEKLFANQNGVCKICSESITKLDDRLNIDHDHMTDKIRGLLCRRCNSSLGRWNEDINRFKSAIEYLKKYGNTSS